MSATVLSGRFTADIPDKAVVFIIGARINKWRAVRKWLPVILAMPPMIRELYTNKDLGFLSMESFFNVRTTLMVQYWTSEEDLIEYARGKTHLTAWKDFNKKARGNDAVGIYHETYIIRNGQAEAVYVNMPEFGLAKAFERKSITPSTHSARQRLKQPVQ
ncbi:DUF4188 domain-containing protein [Indiicoccus explosivorum]|uniref:DUF4188 domain-containing protein n=1 Tax=Indiicoccus explosivorum TaxID=1917864 RepID=UPI000B44D8D8|nr:DUF4188 domain-containing protein [Indiicoccus explosivorum]